MYRVKLTATASEMSARSLGVDGRSDPDTFLFL